jgi:hypothetical protein
MYLRNGNGNEWILSSTFVPDPHLSVKELKSYIKATGTDNYAIIRIYIFETFFLQPCKKGICSEWSECVFDHFCWEFATELQQTDVNEGFQLVANLCQWKNS